MDKLYLKSKELIELSSQHAYAAELILQSEGEVVFVDGSHQEGLYAISTLLYIAIELILKAYLFHSHKPHYRHLKLSEMIDMNHELDFSKEDIEILKQLSKIQAFRKGIDYQLWESREAFHAFCEKVMSLYARIHDIMPLELQQMYSEI
tara:strand:- start:259 stop:705 length:447 start_codon:yes stop_codon:yes gene_type:complete